MLYLRIAIWVIAIGVIAAVMDYSIPEREVVRITGVDVKRLDQNTTNDAGAQVTRTVDVREVYAETREGEALTFQNIDAWTYLKFDSADLTSMASNLASQPADQQWAVITYYGWRWPIMSWFPNAIDLEPASEETELSILPNAIIVTVIVVVLAVLRRLFLIMVGRLFGGRNSDPGVQA
ncbi:MAG: DUF1523 family protein [Pseudomonadota bacterium]